MAVGAHFDVTYCCIDDLPRALRTRAVTMGEEQCGAVTMGRVTMLQLARRIEEHRPEIAHYSIKVAPPELIHLDQHHWLAIILLWAALRPFEVMFALIWAVL